MISQMNSSVVSASYANNMSKEKLDAKEVGTKNATQQMDKVEKLKQAIESGEYKVDISAVAEKMADELLQ